MKDRTNRPLAALGFGGRKSLERHLRLQRDLDEDRQLGSIGNSDEDEEFLPPPKPTRSRSFDVPGARGANWVARADSDIDDLLHVLNDRCGDLNAWEVDFLSSVNEFATAKGGLTVRQYETLTKLAEKYT